MLIFLLRALAKMAVTLFVIVTIVFFATRLSGDAIDFIGGDALDAQSRAELIVYYGLREDMVTQYWRFLRGMIEGEFGLSLIERRPVTTIFLERVGPTLQLVGTAILVTLVIAIPAGIYAAIRRRSNGAKAVMTGAFIGYATPNFVMATLLLLVFSYWLRLLPSAGNGSWAHFIMPVTALSLTYIAALIRYTRNATLDVLGQDYLRTARAKGLPERTVITRHAMRNTLITVLSVFGLMVTGPGLCGCRGDRNRLLLAGNRRSPRHGGDPARLPGPAISVSSPWRAPSSSSTSSPISPTRWWIRACGWERGHHDDTDCTLFPGRVRRPARPVARCRPARTRRLHPGAYPARSGLVRPVYRTGRSECAEPAGAPAPAPGFRPCRFRLLAGHG